MIIASMIYEFERVKYRWKDLSDGSQTLITSTGAEGNLVLSACFYSLCRY